MNDAVVTEIVDLNKKSEPKPEVPPELLETTMPMPETYDLTILPGFIEIIPITKKQKEPSPNAIGMFSLGNAKDLKRLFEAINTIVDEVTIKFDMDSLSIRQMDPSRVAMIDYQIDKRQFEEWHVTKPGLTCFNIESVLDVALSKLKKDTMVKVEFNEREITFTLKDAKERVRTFPLLEPNQEIPPTPQLRFNARYKVIAQVLQEDIEDLSKVSDHVVFVGDNENLILKAEGDIVKGQNKHSRGGECILDIETSEPSKATYSLSYLTEFFKKGTALSEVTTLEFSTDMPIKITVQSPQFGDLHHYLAPRIETED